MEHIDIKVSGMSCEGCENTVQKVVAAIDGVNSVEADHTSGLVRVSMGRSVELEHIRNAIEAAGYAVA